MMPLIQGDRVNAQSEARYLIATDGKAEPMYCIEYRVIGRGNFPYDMLRHDMAHPVGPDDAANLQHPHEIADTSDPEGYATALRQTRTVKLRTWTRNKHWQPTYGRWASFGWHVLTNVMDVS
jgi:hypothetical protein